MTPNYTTRGYFEAKLFNVSKALTAYSGELSRKDDMLHKPITQAYAIRNDNKLSLFVCERQFLNINNVRGAVDVVVFPNARCAASASKMKKGSGSSSEKAKPLKYLRVTLVQ